MHIAIKNRKINRFEKKKKEEKTKKKQCRLEDKNTWNGRRREA